MDYWEGYMDWPLDKDWVCETCGENAGLTWGMPHAQCRCNKCHTVYTMRDAKDAVVETPICCLKDEYREPAKIGFEKFGIPLSAFSDEQWETLELEGE